MRLTENLFGYFQNLCLLPGSRLWLEFGRLDPGKAVKTVSHFQFYGAAANIWNIAGVAFPAGDGQTFSQAVSAALMSNRTRPVLLHLCGNPNPGGGGGGGGCGSADPGSEQVFEVNTFHPPGCCWMEG